MSQPVIQLSGIFRDYVSEFNETAERIKVRVLRDLELEVNQGQFVAIQGESGAGKSTLLRILGMMDRAYSGSYRLGGHSIKNGQQEMPWGQQEEMRAKLIGFIFQEDRLMEHLSVRQNIELPLRIQRRWSRREAANLEEAYQRTFVREDLDKHLLDRRRSALSGGQRQRAAVLRAISHAPLLLLADEPTASLDPDSKEKVFEHLQNLSREGRTIVVVSHDQIFERAEVLYRLNRGFLEKVTSVRAATRAAAASPEPRAMGAAASAGSASAVGQEDGAYRDEAPDGRSGTSASSPAGAPTGRTKPATLSSPTSAEPLKAGWLPRAPSVLHLSLAARDLWRNRLFTILTAGAIAAGSFQLLLLGSLRSGTSALLDSEIRQGSRLNRITIGMKAQNLLAEKRFPDLDKIAAIPGVTKVIPRHEAVYRVQDHRGRSRVETIFGLEPDDPEFEKLQFTAGAKFSSEGAVEVVMSERSIPRLFEVPGGTVTGAMRQSLIGKEIPLTVKRTRPGVRPEDATEDSAFEDLTVQARIAGIVTQAESSRNFYLPKLTQLLLERWRLDESRSFQPPLNASRNAWTLPLPDLHKLIDFSWEEQVYVYFGDLEKVMAGFKDLQSMQYSPQSQILDFQWVLHTRKLANMVIIGLVLLISGIAGLIIAGNISIAVRMRVKEIVLLKLLGMRNADVSLIYLWNAMMAALLGTVIGSGAGFAGVEWLRHFVDRNFGARFASLLGPVAPVAGWVVLASIAWAVVFSVLPARQAGRTDPLRGFSA
jgi:putative ABC transport system ATP-binding protein